MGLFILIFFLIIGLALYINGNTPLAQEVLQTSSPKMIEAYMYELKARKHIGQIIMMVSGFLLMFNLDFIGL